MTRLARVCGIETEYGVTSVDISGDTICSQPPLSVEDAVKEIFASTERAIRVPHGFLSNGARLYVDIGSHPEYAGPECLDLEDVVAQDLAGDAIIQDLVDKANTKLVSRGIRIHALKTNADSWGNSFGCHENYQYRADAPLSIPALVTFLAARQILCGSGSIDSAGKYCFSARAHYITEAASADPTHHKAFINTKEEPHADAAVWRRLHVTCADSAMLPITVALRVYLADRFLTRLETLDETSFTILDNPVAAVKAWNYDPQVQLPARRGQVSTTVNCLELLEEILALITDNTADKWGLREVASRGIKAIGEGNLTAMSQELDWSLKYQLLSQVSSGEADFNGFRARRADLAFHDLSRDYGIRERLVTSGNVKSIINVSKMSLAKISPPSNTRAALRGKVVEACDLAKRKASIGWSYVRLDEPPSPQIDLLDPLGSQSEEVDRLLEQLDTLKGQ